MSEYLIVRTIVKASQGRSIFYVLPTYNLVGRFVQNRVNRALMVVPYYKKIMKESEIATAEGMLLKHIGTGAVSFVGSNSATPFTEFPADDLHVDELDQCDSENLEMAVERLSNSKHKQICKVSNPTIQGIKIDYEYIKSDQKKWFIKCEHCNNEFHPDFFENVVQEVGIKKYILRDEKFEAGMSRDIGLMCRKCGKPVNRFSLGKWHKTAKSDISGYHVSKLFSTNVTIKEIANRFEEGLSNDSIMQRFYNGDLGLAYTASGSHIDSAMLDACVVKDHQMPNSTDEPCIAGVDVGSVFHVIIAEARTNKIVYIGELPVHDVSEVTNLFKQYSVKMFVIDALPETRIARMIVSRSKFGFMNYYSGVKNELTINASDRIISSNRTVSLDAVKEAILLRTFIFPANAKSVGGFYDQMTSSTRVYNEEKDAYNWIESGPDHYFHAFCYMLLCKKLLVMAT
jgi:hypothetical protein